MVHTCSCVSVYVCVFICVCVCDFNFKRFLGLKLLIDDNDFAKTSVAYDQ